MARYVYRTKYDTRKDGSAIGPVYNPWDSTRRREVKLAKQPRKIPAPRKIHLSPGTPRDTKWPQSLGPQAIRPLINRV